MPRGSGRSSRWSEDFGRALVKRARNRLNPRIVAADASCPAADSFSQTPCMPAFEDWMNRLSDMDSGWWPFLSQRPPKDVLIDDAKLLSMSVRFGPTYGAVITAAAMGTGAVERGVHYMQLYPGVGGKILFCITPIAVFMAGVRILDSLEREREGDC